MTIAAFCGLAFKPLGIAQAVGVHLVTDQLVQRGVVQADAIPVVRFALPSLLLADGEFLGTDEAQVAVALEAWSNCVGRIRVR